MLKKELMHNSDCHPLIVHKTVLDIADIIT